MADAPQATVRPTALEIAALAWALEGQMNAGDLPVLQANAVGSLLTAAAIARLAASVEVLTGLQLQAKAPAEEKRVKVAGLTGGE